MKNQITVTAILLLTLFFLISLSGIAQEKEKEKQVRIKTIKVEDGKKLVKDTTFTVKEGEDVKEIIEGLNWLSDDDSVKVLKNVYINDEGKGRKKVIIMSRDGEESVKVFESDTDAMFFSDGDSLKEIKVEVIVDEEYTGRGEKVIVIRTDGDKEIVKEIIVPSYHLGHKRVMKIKTDDGEEELIIVLPHGHHKSMVWKSEDGLEYDFDFDYDMDFDHEQFKAEMEVHMKEMENTKMIMLDEKMAMLHELEELKELENMEIEIIRPPRPPKHHDFAMRRIERFDKVTDKELRDAGIKNKPDRLELDNININLNKGVIDLTFTMKGEGSPKIEVYNFFGDKVFSGKPELINGSYKIVIDLSQKQHGTYYLQIINKNSSFTEKIRL